jgi:DNA-binding beta-propeller fold protein YncE
LANFVKDASKAYSFDLQYVIAIGYSNGANIASSMLLLLHGMHDFGKIYFLAPYSFGKTNKILTDIKVGDNPNAITISSITNKVYVANDASHDVSILDASKNSIVGNISHGL